jgi:ferredoxin
MTGRRAEQAKERTMKDGTMNVTVDWNLCDGNGNCTAEAPEVFALNDDDELDLLLAEPGEELRPGVEMAAAACPKRAITIEG